MHGSNEKRPGGSAKTQTEDLWEKAYQSVKDKYPDLVSRFKNSLTSNNTSHPRSWTPSYLQTIAESKLTAHDANQLIIRLGHTSIKVRQQWDRIVKLMFWAKNSISAIVSSQPYAAIAWTGVSILLPLLLNASSENDAMMKGLDFISYFLPLHSYKAPIYLLDKNEVTHPQFSKPFQELYTSIFEYQIGLFCHLSDTAVKRLARNVLMLND